MNFERIEKMDGFTIKGDFKPLADGTMEFLGGTVKRDNTQFVKRANIMFEGAFEQGQITTFIQTREIGENNRVGFIFRYSNINSIEKYYQVSFEQQGCFLSLWGSPNPDQNGGGAIIKCSNFNIKMEENKKYKIEMKLAGSRGSFFVNGICALIFDIDHSIVGQVAGINISSSKNININLKDTVFKTYQPTAFVIMKFEKDFQDLYDQVIYDVCDKNGYNVCKADEIYLSSNILQDIIKNIATASLIIADVTMDNPNVFYELGYAHALNKPTIILADRKKRERLPFDISGFRTIMYENSIGGKAEVEKLLQKYIEKIQSNTY